MQRKKSGIAVLATVGAAGLLLTACFSANLSGRAKTGSVIQGGKTIELEINSTDSLGTGIGSLRGKFKDAGTSPAFPYGVSLSFNKGTTFGLGFSCSDVVEPTTTSTSSTTSSTVAGPQRLVHATRPQGTTPFDGFCNAPGTENSRVWFGYLTYSSADRRVPNVQTPECAVLYYYYLHFGGLGFGQPNTKSSTPVDYSSLRSAALKDPASKAITGFAEMVIVDTNHDGQPGPTDGFGMATICGPNANLDANALFNAPVGQSCSANTRCPSQYYSYATCGSDAFGYGGVYPSEIAWGDVVAPGHNGPAPAYSGSGPLNILSMLLGQCGGSISSGNLKIGIATDWGSGVTGPIGLPN